MSDDGGAKPGESPATTSSRRRRPRDVAAEAVGAVVVLAVLVILGVDEGGYLPPTFLAAGIVAALGGAAVLTLRSRRWRPARSGLVALAALAGFAAWVGLSSLWSPLPGNATSEMQRTIAYVAILVLGIVVVGSGRYAGRLVVLVAAALAALGILGLLSRLAPALDLAPVLEPSSGTYRLSFPIPYWNGQGTGVGMAIVLAIAIAADRRSPIVVQAVAAAVVPALAVTLLLTVSRGAIAATACGLLVLLALSRRPLQTLIVGVACGLPAAIVVGRAASLPAVVDDPTAGAGLSDAGGPLLVLVALMGAVAATTAVLSLRTMQRAERRRALWPTTPQWVPWALTGAAVLVAMVGALIYQGPLDRGLLRGADFVEDQRRSFVEGAPVAVSGLERLGTVGGTRSALYEVAWDAFVDRPLAGDGAAGFRIRWLREREIAERVQNAHSLPLETLAELGLPGFLLLAAFFAAIATGAVRARRRPRALPRSLAAGASGALVVFVVSCAVDWTWQLGVLTAAALILAATLLPEGRPMRSRRA
ncbi:MAG: O-antigen ligase family protein [Solirubrobacteraceae bacterium]